jgi:hypothetical protein
LDSTFLERWSGQRFLATVREPGRLLLAGGADLRGASYTNAQSA